MIGIIGGTGLYSIDGLELLEKQDVKTPFGPPSALVACGKLNGQNIAFLPRHGVHHQFLPHEINYRANIWALKSVGARELISVSAVGSLCKEIKPGDLVLASQYFDWTRGKRASSFFGEGLSAHISTAEPTCAWLGQALKKAAQKSEIAVHTEKTYVCVEGPRLGTRAESHFLKSTGAHVVGMTNIPEAFLAREAQLCYVTLAVATDYDCWMDDPNEHVTLEKMLEIYGKSLVKVKLLLRCFVLNQTEEAISCNCRQALKDAILSKHIPNEKQEILKFLKR